MTRCQITIQLDIMDDAKKMMTDVIEDLAKVLKDTGEQTSKKVEEVTSSETMQKLKRASVVTLEKAEVLKTKAEETKNSMMEEMSKMISKSPKMSAALDKGEEVGKILKEKVSEGSEKLKLAAQGATIVALDKGEELGKLIKEKVNTDKILEKSREAAYIAWEKGGEAGKFMKDKSAQAMIAILDKCDAGKSIMKASNEKFQEACRVVCDKRGQKGGDEAKKRCEETCKSLNQMRDEVMKMADEAKSKKD